jgi:hypothetical protein
VIRVVGSQKVRQATQRAPVWSAKKHNSDDMASVPLALAAPSASQQQQQQQPPLALSMQSTPKKAPTRRPVVADSPRSEISQYSFGTNFTSDDELFLPVNQNAVPRTPPRKLLVGRRRQRRWENDAHVLISGHDFWVSPTESSIDNDMQLRVVLVHHPDAFELLQLDSALMEIFADAATPAPRGNGLVTRRRSREEEMLLRVERRARAHLKTYGRKLLPLLVDLEAFLLRALNAPKKAPLPCCEVPESLARSIEPGQLVVHNDSVVSLPVSFQNGSLRLLAIACAQFHGILVSKPGDLDHDCVEFRRTRLTTSALGAAPSITTLLA